MVTTVTNERDSVLTETQRALVAQHLAYARQLASSWKALDPTVGDEFESAAMMALVMAARTFDPARGVKFTTYARHRVIGVLRDVRRQTCRRRRLVGELRNSDSGALDQSRALLGHRRASTMFASDDPEIDKESERLDLVGWLLNGLPDKHASACRLIYFEGQSLVQTASRLKLSLSRINCLHREALTILRQRGNDEQWD
jgi:RNA polymerase sigma factor (sigma-70 family)